MTNNTTFYDFNRSNKSLQVAMNFDVETIIPEDCKVSLVCTIVERMNLSTVISTYSKRGRKPVLDPVTFLKIILFCYSEGIFHSRKIEKFCIYDLRKSIKVRFNHIRNHCERENIEFVYGSGKHKTVEQREYEYLEKALERLETYRNLLEIMGDRNSYSKTDQDATFMRMKEDHMRNGQLKPAYNIQLASTGAFIVGVMGSQKANDLQTLKPFLNQMFPVYGKSMKNIVADAGYESVENYVYLNEKNLISYIEPSNYEVKKTKKRRKDIGRKENMLYFGRERCLPV